jgi:hypothetical protein
MKKNIIICGLIAGLIVTSVMMAAMARYYSQNIEGSMLFGYTTMLVAFSLIFVGVKNARDKYNGGTISFGKAFRVGLLITLIASTMYVVVWMIDYFYFIPDFFERYTAHSLSKMKAAGATAAELQKHSIESQNMEKMYKNPIFTALFTYLEILPVGLIVSIVAALILKRKPGNMVQTEAVTQ